MHQTLSLQHKTVIEQVTHGIISLEEVGQTWMNRSLWGYVNQELKKGVIGPFSTVGMSR